MRCRSVSLSCKGKINHLIRLPVIFSVADSSSDAETRLERLRACVEQLRIPSVNGADGADNDGVAVTVSIGYCLRVPEPGQSSAHWLQMADRAVYEAKRRGRNRVVEEAGSKPLGA